MAKLKILTAGDPVLRQTAAEVTKIDKKLIKLLKDMADTMYAAEGVGLAAPQIGVSKRIVVIDVGDGIIEMINPVIVNKEGSVVGGEGCLSVPEYEGEVEVGGILTIAIANDISAPVAQGEPAFTVSCANPDGDAQQFDIYTPVGGFAAGDVIIISSIPGDKGCYYIDETEAVINALNLISQNPDWIKIKPGINTILITDPNEAIDTADFENPICYEGV